MLPRSATKKYKVNEIFYSLQAEGRNAGTPAVFVRFSGCNLQCPFCDTNHEPFVEMTKDEIEARVKELDPSGEAMVVITGGEPTLQLTENEPMFENRYVAMETNGIIKATRWVKWVTISPKTKLSQAKLSNANELKFLYGWFDDKYLTEVIEPFAMLYGIKLYIQPTADKDGKFDIHPAAEFAKAHPVWCLSLQWHKLFNIQ